MCEKYGKEYSKKAIAAMIVLWFAVAVFGMVVVIYQLSQYEYHGHVPSRAHRPE